MKELRDDRVHMRMALVRELFGLEDEDGTAVAGTDTVAEPAEAPLANVRPLRR